MAVRADKNLKKHTFNVTMPDGVVETRTSTHDYQFVVAYLVERQRGMVWTIAQWTSRMDLAQKAYDKSAQHFTPDTIKIIPVNNPRTEEEKAQVE